MRLTLRRLLAKNDERHAHTLTSTRSTILTAPRSEAVSTSNQFGTFGGVFTPSILTILGAVMFMRAGFVTGQAGVGTMLVILLVSKLITLLTGLSISAISSNTRVRGGGAYFLISRSLGPEFGASIGLALFLAQALSVPFYVLAFAEALVTTRPHLKPDFMAIGFGVTAALFVINYVGSSWAIRAQYLILAALIGSVVVFLTGGALVFDTSTFAANWAPAYTGPEHNFWTSFAVFFPAVTGIMAGVNMSGDLKEPDRSIPTGTLAAIGVGALIYMLEIFVLGGSTPRATLIARPFESLLDVALFGWRDAVVMGVYAATLSSAIGSMMGAPRILQALARDGIFKAIEPFGEGTPQGDEPRKGLWLTLAMTLGVLVLAGDGSGGGALNLVASVLTMFFLFTYGMTNAAACIEHLSRNPSFRPRFRYFHWSTALAGGFGCFGAAFLINPLAAAAALALIVAIFFYVSRRVLDATFGDARRGFVYERVRMNLRQLASHPQHAKNWRPSTLVLTGNPANRLTLTSYAHWLAGGAGLVTLANVIVGDLHEQLQHRREMLAELDTFIRARELDAFADVHIAPSFEVGLAALMQSHSIGPIRPNMIVFGWSHDPERADWFGRHLRLVTELEMSQVILFDKGLPERGPLGEPWRIDVWWRGLENGSLMVILAHLLTDNWAWRRARIRLLHLSAPDEDIEQVRQRMTRLVREGRLDAEIVIVDHERIEDAVHEHSHDADLVMLGFRPPEDDESAGRFHSFYTALTERLPTTLLVCSAGEADLLS